MGENNHAQRLVAALNAEMREAQEEERALLQALGQMIRNGNNVDLDSFMSDRCAISARRHQVRIRIQTVYEALGIEFDWAKEGQEPTVPDVGHEAP